MNLLWADKKSHFLPWNKRSPEKHQVVKITKSSSVLIAVPSVYLEEYISAKPNLQFASSAACTMIACLHILVT